MTETSLRNRTVEAVARLLEESSFGTAGARQLRDRVSISEAAEIRARAYMAGDLSDMAWWEANRHNPAALRARAARLARQGNPEISRILAWLADWDDSQEPPRPASLIPAAVPPPLTDGEDWRTFASFYQREYSALCGILSERASLPSKLSEKLITRAMREAFDDWANVVASGNPGEWVIGCALQHYRALGLPDEDSSWTHDPQSTPAAAPFPGTPPGNMQATAMRVAGALATSASLAPASCTIAVAELEADHMYTVTYRSQYQSLVRLAQLLVHDTPTAEEVVQDAFVAMHTGWRRLRDTDKALSYLRQAVVNRSRSVLRHRAVVSRNEPEPVPGEPSAESEAITLLERSAVITALRSLPDRQREAIVLRYYADLSEADIAATMGISKGAVKSHTARGMSALRSILAQQTA